MFVALDLKMADRIHDSYVVSHEEVTQEIGAAVQKLFARSGLQVGPGDVDKLLAENAALPSNEQLPKTVGVAVRFAIGSVTRADTKDIKTREDLDKVLRTIEEATEKVPTMIRAALKMFQSGLPRAGGPGRKPKLDSQESVIICMEILSFIAQGRTVTEAIDKTSEKCPALLGKMVSPRTLRKAWNKRDEFIGKSSD